MCNAIIKLFFDRYPLYEGVICSGGFSGFIWLSAEKFNEKIDATFNAKDNKYVIINMYMLIFVYRLDIGVHTLDLFKGNNICHAILLSFLIKMVR